VKHSEGRTAPSVQYCTRCSVGIALVSVMFGAAGAMGFPNPAAKD